MYLVLYVYLSHHLVREWKCVTMLLWCVTAKEGSASAIARNLPWKLTSFKFVYKVHLLLNYPVILKNHSILCQWEQLLLSANKLHVKNTMSPIKSFKISRSVNMNYSISCLQFHPGHCIQSWCTLRVPKQLIIRRSFNEENIPALQMFGYRALLLILLIPVPI
jgi:hypothetical protein